MYYVTDETSCTINGIGCWNSERAAETVQIAPPEGWCHHYL